MFNGKMLTCIKPPKIKVHSFDDELQKRDLLEWVEVKQRRMLLKDQEHQYNMSKLLDKSKKIAWYFDIFNVLLFIFAVVLLVRMLTK